MELTGPTHGRAAEASTSKQHSRTSCALASPYASPRVKVGCDDPALAISISEATPHHVFAHIEALEQHANEELWEGVCYAALPLPFGTAFGAGKAEDFYPTIKEALGMRDHEAQDESEQDAALATRHTIQWYYFAVRCSEPGQPYQKFAVIKARTPCLALVIKMLGLSAEIAREVAHGATFAPVVLLGASIGPCCDDLREGAAIARRLWRAGRSRGGHTLPTPHGETNAALHGFSWMIMPDEAAMHGLWTATFLHPSARHLALMRKLQLASRVAAPFLQLHKESLEKLYAPSGAGYKRARDEFESHLVPHEEGKRWSA